MSAELAAEVPGGGTRRVAVIGAGVIGAGWAAQFLAHGLDVTACDADPAAEEDLRRAVAAAWPALSRLGLHERASIERLDFTVDVVAAVDGADFVQESGPESLPLKHQLLAELDATAPAGVVIASSTSGLMPSQLQTACARHPERVLVGHPFHPTHLIPLVEVVPGRRTAPESVERAVAFYEYVCKRPIVVRQEVPGHVTNRLQAALWREAYSLVERGVATVADIDAAISHGPGLRWALLGPLANQHLSGGAGGMARTLEHLGPPAQAWMDDLGAPRLTPRLVELLVRGVQEELAGVDEALMVARRDELLLDLLASKRHNDPLP